MRPDEFRSEGIGGLEAAPERPEADARQGAAHDVLGEVVGDRPSVENDRLRVAAVQIVEQDDLAAAELSRTADDIRPSGEGEVLEIARHVAVEVDPSRVSLRRGQANRDRHAFLPTVRRVSTALAESRGAARQFSLTERDAFAFNPRARIAVQILGVLAVEDVFDHQPGHHAVVDLPAREQIDECIGVADESESLGVLLLADQGHPHARLQTCVEGPKAERSDDAVRRHFREFFVRAAVLTPQDMPGEAGKKRPAVVDALDFEAVDHRLGDVPVLVAARERERVNTCSM